MRKLDTAQECGLRLKRIRDAKNMTQQELAELIHVSPQAISKYEKNGISDINTINDISRALGWDLLTDEQNEEGTVGEVGKEILFKLVENNGFILVDTLNKGMYGLNNDRITNEIIKLQRIGMVVREQYNDFYDIKTDGLFITAKGIICIKNILPNRGRDTDYEELIQETVSFEERIEDGNSYQDYFKRKKAENLIRNLPNIGCYRIDFIQHLLSTCLDDYCGSSLNEWLVDESIYVRPGKYPLLPGENCYFDILFRMAIDFNNDKIEKYILSCDSEDEWDKEQELTALGVELGKEEEFIISSARRKFEEMSHSIKVMKTNNGLADQEDSSLIEEIESEIDEKEKHYLTLRQEQENAFFANTVEDMDFFMLDNPEWQYQESAYPMDWYSIEEIFEFVKENYRPAASEEEKILDEKIKQIAEVQPDVLKYYDFPREWEDAGIGEYIRSIYNIPNKKE